MDRQISTVCARDCYDTCSLRVTLADTGRIASIKGDPSHPVTQGFTCPRGAKDHERLLKNRVEAPVLRQEDRLEPTDWEQGLSVVTRKLTDVLYRHGPEAVLYLDYAGNTGLLTEQFPRRLWNCIGATLTDGALCTRSGREALGLHYGDSYGLTPTELLSMRVIVFWGFNAAASSPHIWRLAKQARVQHGARIVVVDPIRNRTAEGADLWIRPRPGSDVALAYGLVNHLIERDLVDREFVSKWTTGFDELQLKAGEWSLEKTERTTGVPRRQIEELGDMYGIAKPSATMIGIGLQKCDRGADQVRAVSFIPALLGLHRGFFYTNGNGYRVDVPMLSGETLTTNPPRIVSQVALADLVARGEFKFIYVSGMNPAVTLPNLHAFREGLSRQDVFVVVHETHWTKTTEYADVVLPAPTYLEKDDLVVPWSHNYIRYSNRAVHPVTDSRSEVWVMREIAKRLALKEEWLYQDPWAAVELALEDALEDGSYQSLKSGEMLRLKMKPRNHYPTPSGKIEFHSSRAVASGFDPLPVQAPLDVEDGRLVLLTSATPRYTSTQFQEVYGPIPAVITINPRDAERGSIAEGDVVSVASELGQVQMKATISDAVSLGVTWAPRQSEGLAGEPLNCLMSGEPQEIGSGPRFNSTRVTVTRRRGASPG